MGNHKLCWCPFQRPLSEWVFWSGFLLGPGPSVSKSKCIPYTAIICTAIIPTRNQKMGKYQKIKKKSPVFVKLQLPRLVWGLSKILGCFRKSATLSDIIASWWRRLSEAGQQASAWGAVSLYFNQELMKISIIDINIKCCKEYQKQFDIL